MKKVLIGLFVMMGLVACNEQQRNAVDSVLRTEQHAKEVLEKTAEAVNASCPVPAGDKYMLVGVLLSDGKWTYCYTVAEDSVVRFDNPLSNEAFAKGMKNATAETMVQTPSMMKMVNQLIEAKTDLMYEYTGVETGKTVTIIFTYPELRMIRDMSHNSQ
ncbi:MAG: hypothetical protein IJT28_00320 [Bacteroidaceae bacterium]|nr:hypothetical protein [Bacteroidaceae bacterium]